jgi:hypothetical protein
MSGGTICPGGSFTLLPAGAVNYTFSSGSPVVSPVITTTYSVVGTDQNGCISVTPAVATVQVQNAILVTVGSGSVCAGDSFTLMPSGANSYSYSSGTSVVSPASTTTYSVWGSSAGCVSPAPAVATITVHQLPVVAVTGGTLCAGESFTFAPSGASTYSYSSGTAVVGPPATSVYTISGTDSIGCKSSPVSVTVVVNQIPVLTFPGGSVCLGGSFTLNPSGAASYTFSSGSNVVTPPLTSTFSVVGTDTNGCVSGASVAQVTVHPLPQIQLAASQSVICKGEAIALSSSGANSYTWSAPGYSATSVSGAVTVTPGSTAAYQVTGANEHGCTATASVLIQVEVCPGVAEQSISFALHPNPTTGFFYVSTPQPVRLTIMNDMGQVVLNADLDAGTSVVDAEHLKRGIYFVVLRGEPGLSTTKLIRY